MSPREWIDLTLALLCGYFCGLWFGYARANREYKAAVDLAVADYRESVRLITKLRHRLQAQRWYKRKHSQSDARGVEKS